MKNAVLIFLIFFTSLEISLAQGTIRGKVSDVNGETLIGVTLVLKSNRSIGCATDFDGNYSLKIADSLPQTILVSFISYQTLEVIVHPKKGEILIKDFVLKPSAQDIKEVEIVAKATKARDYYMESLKKNQQQP